MKIIEDAWNSYRLKVMPANASRVQVEETRRAFYCGALALFARVMQGLSAGSEPSDADEEMLKSIDLELATFAASFSDEVPS